MNIERKITEEVTAKKKPRVRSGKIYHEVSIDPSSKPGIKKEWGIIQYGAKLDRVKSSDSRIDVSSIRLHLEDAVVVNMDRYVPMKSKMRVYYRVGDLHIGWLIPYETYRELQTFLNILPDFDLLEDAAYNGLPLANRIALLKGLKYSLEYFRNVMM